MHQSKAAVAFINIGHAVDHMFMLIFPTAVLAMGAEFDRPFGELLALSLGGFIAFGAGSLPAGWLGDRWSRRNMMAVFFLGIGAAAILTGFSRSPFMLAAGLTLIGLFAAIYHPVGTAMLVAHAEKLGRELSVNAIWGNFGVAFAALMTGALAEWLGWRYAFIVPGAIAILIGLAFTALVPRTGKVTKRAARHGQGRIPRAVVVRAFLVLAVVTVAGGVVFNAITVSMPKLFDERLAALAGSSLGIGALVAAVYTVGAVAQLLVGRYVDRHPLKTVFIPLALLQAPCLLLAAHSTDWLLVALAAGVVFAIFGQVVINDAMVARYTDDAWRARAYSVRYLVSFGAAAAAVPLVALIHGGAGGFAETYLVLAGFGLAVFLGALAFPHRPDELAPAPAPEVQPAE
jgi:MFS family permease